MLTVCRKSNVVPSGAAAAANVVAERAAMLIRRHLEPRGLAGFHIDHYPLDHRHIFVTNKRILPCFELRMTVRHRDKV